MKTRTKIILNATLSVAITIAVVWAFQKYNTPKVGYVKSQIIIQDYKEMISASDQFDQELKLVQNNLDTLQARYEALRAREFQITEKEKKEWTYQIQVAQNEFENYNMQVSQQMEARRNELTGKVLQTINDYIQKYGKDNNYKMILGTTNDGSILYGLESDDLTQIILAQMNEAYALKGGSTNKLSK